MEIIMKVLLELDRNEGLHITYGDREDSIFIIRKGLIYTIQEDSQRSLIVSQGTLAEMYKELYRLSEPLLLDKFSPVQEP